MGQPLLSVIIPTFGRQAWVNRAVASVIEQQVDCEVLVVDDASPVAIAVEPGQKGTTVVRSILRTSNGGAGAARNTGIAHARGRLVTFLDSDDWMLPHTLADRIAAARALGAEGGDPVAVGCGWVEVRDGRIVRRRIPREPQHPLDFAGGCWVNPGSAVILNRAALAAAGSFDQRLRRLEDVDFFLRFALAGGRFAVDPRLGVAITRGSVRAEVEVTQAITDLRERYAGQLAAPFDKRLDAYVFLERARLAWARGDIARVLWYLAHSFLLMPRLRLTTGPGWRDGSSAG